MGLDSDAALEFYSGGAEFESRTEYRLSSDFSWFFFLGPSIIPEI